MQSADTISIKYQKEKATLSFRVALDISFNPFSF